MKQIIRLTESDLMEIIKTSVKRALNEDVLGNDWNVDDDVRNNYEPFKIENDPFEGHEDHDFGVQGEKEFDPTEYDPEAYWEDDHDPTDSELYHNMA